MVPGAHLRPCCHYPDKDSDTRDGKSPAQTLQHVRQGAGPEPATGRTEQRGQVLLLTPQVGSSQLLKCLGFLLA